MRRRQRWAAVVVLLVAALSVSWVGAARAAGRTWFVSAAAVAGGDGSMGRPFASLAAVQAAAGPGDTIEVLPSAGVLDGGIVLKPGQQLVGAGPPVTGLAAGAVAPRLENTTAAAGSGDAVELADGATVSNLVIVGAYRGGIYGHDVSGVTVTGNDLGATNSSCTTGFVVQPFSVPTTVPGASVPFSNGLSNGWAAVMVDEDASTDAITVSGNSVHDGTCNDGIDVRVSGAAHVTATVNGNTLTRLQQAPTLSSILAIGMQAIGTSTLTAQLAGNSETYIGSAVVSGTGEADSEGIFENAAGAAHLTETVTGNTFAHGLGHLSANCVEEIISNGAAVESMAISDSTCTDVIGDILEAVNLSTNSTMSMSLDHVAASHSTLPGATAVSEAIPADEGDCLNELATGSGSTTMVTVAHSQLTDCVANGLAAVANVVDGTGLPVAKLGFSITDSVLTGNAISGVHVENYTGLTELDGLVARSDLSSPGTPVLLEQRPPEGATTHATLDFGGGALGSVGDNCIVGSGAADVTSTGYDAHLQNDWWGSPAGPTDSRTTAIGAVLTDTPFLAAATCGANAPQASTPSPGATSPASARATPAAPRATRSAASPARAASTPAAATTRRAADAGAARSTAPAGLAATGPAPWPPVVAFLALALLAAGGAVRGRGRGPRHRGGRRAAGR